MDIRAGFRRAFTGDRQRERPPGDSVTLGDARRAYGSWRGVASAMGVSERTLRRIRNEGRVTDASRRRLDSLGSQGPVRRAAVRPRAAQRGAQRAQRGATVTISGDQGPTGYGRGNYRRNRTISFELSPDQIAEIESAYLDGDDQRAIELLGDAAQDDYGAGRIPGDGWDFGDLSNFNIQDPGFDGE